MSHNTRGSEFHFEPQRGAVTYHYCCRVAAYLFFFKFIKDDVARLSYAAPSVLSFRYALVYFCYRSDDACRLLAGRA